MYSILKQIQNFVLKGNFRSRSKIFVTNLLSRLWTCMILILKWKFSNGVFAVLALHTNQFSHFSLWPLSQSDSAANSEGTAQQQDKPRTTPSIQPLMLALPPSTLTTWESKLWLKKLESKQRRPFWKTTSCRKNHRMGRKWRNWTNSCWYPAVFLDNALNLFTNQRSLYLLLFIRTCSIFAR